MPRKQRENTPEEENLLASRAEKRVRRRNTTMVKGERLPQELIFLKEMAIILKIAGYTPFQIAKTLGVKKSQVKSWFKESDVTEKMHRIMQSIPQAALSMMEAYTIEALHAVVDVMRTSEDDKFVLEAAREILNRGGLPAMSRSEGHVTREDKVTFTDEGVIEALRNCSPEVQEKAAEIVEQAEKALQELVAAGASEEEQQMIVESAEAKVREIAERSLPPSEESTE